MREIKSLLASGLAAFTLLGVSHAQLLPLDYSSNWQPLQAGASTAFSGPGLWGAISPGSVGGSIRRCYGVDSTQGGRNQSSGRYEVTWIKVAQAWGPAAPVPGNNIGLVSVQAATDGDLRADSCISPFAKSGLGSGGHKIGAAAILGLQSGTAGAAFPAVWESAFQWLGSSIGTSVALGMDSAGLPLLINLIYEIQSPLNVGALSVQYYVASTTEVTGHDPGGPGGVTNGNAALGILAYGAPPHLTGALSHSRVITGGSGGFFAGPAPFISTPGDVEFSSHVAFQTPVLWGINDGNDGAGGCDWRVGVTPVSIIDVRLMDNLAGAETTRNVYWKTTLAPGGPGAGFNPNIVFNQSLFLWSATPATSMLQDPMSWDDLAGLLPPRPGSAQLRPRLTKREGRQSIPANLDGLMLAVLPQASLSLGGPFSNSDDIFLDPLGSTGSSQLWEGMFDPIISGVSTLEGGPRPIVAVPRPNLVGLKLGLAGMGIQIDLTQGQFLQVTEVASAMTVNLQP